MGCAGRVSEGLDLKDGWRFGNGELERSRAKWHDQQKTGEEKGKIADGMAMEWVSGS